MFSPINYLLHLCILLSPKSPYNENTKLEILDSKLSKQAERKLLNIFRRFYIKFQKRKCFTWSGIVSSLSLHRFIE
jgi:hypothetical protein